MAYPYIKEFSSKVHDTMITGAASIFDDQHNFPSQDLIAQAAKPTFLCLYGTTKYALGLYVYS